VHSPLFYGDLQVVPRLFRAYRAYDAVLNHVAGKVGWLASGNGFVCSADVLREYFLRAEMTTEFDLRCSLLALAEGLVPICNEVRIHTSARRALASQANLDAWCFYHREFYSTKDINAAVKQNLDCRGEIADLPADKLDAFFARRAFKITSRHFLPFLLFEARPATWARAESATGVAVRELSTLVAFRRRPEILFGHEFEELILAIENHPVAAALSRCLAESMRRHYDAIVAAEHADASAPPNGDGATDARRADLDFASPPMRTPES
jgi:hypothetical protein